MAEKIVVISQQYLKPIKILKWKVKEGFTLSIGSLVLLYDFEKVEKKQHRKLKSPRAGTVCKLLAQEGAIIRPGEALLELAICIHSTVMKDMCAECGADLRKDDINSTASVPMIHSVPELKVSEELAQKIGKADGERLLRDKKLVLLVDLDQTLIHTTNDIIPPNLKDVHHFQLYGPHSPWYHTRLRPGTHQFLTNVASYFELHICTFGARNYAHKITAILDASGQFFSNRVLSRDECFNPTSKTANLKALFPCGDHMVCIIDDREDVWSHASNLIHVKPYHFFKHTGDINAPPGLEKDENDEKEGVDLSKVRSTTVIEERPDRKNNNSVQNIDECSNTVEISSTTSSLEENTVLKKSDTLKNKERVDDIEMKEVDGTKPDEECSSKQPINVNGNVETESVDEAAVESSDVVKHENNKIENKHQREQAEDKVMEEQQPKLNILEQPQEVVPKDITQHQESKPNNLNKQEQPKLNNLSRSEDLKPNNLNQQSEPNSNNLNQPEEPKSNNLNQPEESKPNSLNQPEEPKSNNLNQPEESKPNSLDQPEKSKPNNLNQLEKPKSNNLNQQDELISNILNQSESESEPKVNSLKQSELHNSNKLNQQDEPDSNNLNQLEEPNSNKLNQQDEPNSSNLNHPPEPKPKNLIQQEEPKSNELSQQSIQISNRDETILSLNSSLNIFEIEDPDDYLLYLEDILKRIHKAFYDEYDKMDSGEVPDLKKVIPNVKGEVLKGCKMIFSGLVPTHIKLEHSRAYQVAKSLGAKVTQEFEDDSTHLVAVRPGTAKVNAGRRRKNLKIVTPDWLWACAERWEHVDENIFPLNSKGSKNRHPPPHCSSPEHVPNYAVHETPAQRKRTPSGRFMDTINPLMSFSSADIADMDKEVEDILDAESESEDEGAEKIMDISVPSIRDKEESSSSSGESLTAEMPRGHKRNLEKRQQEDEEGEDDTKDSDEFPSTKFRRGEQLDSDLDIGQDSNSEGSVEAPDEIDDGEWNMMGAALEREFLSNS